MAQQIQSSLFTASLFLQKLRKSYENLSLKFVKVKKIEPQQKRRFLIKKNVYLLIQEAEGVEDAVINEKVRKEFYHRVRTIL